MKCIGGGWRLNWEQCLWSPGRVAVCPTVTGQWPDQKLVVASRARALNDPPAFYFMFHYFKNISFSFSLFIYLWIKYTYNIRGEIIIRYNNEDKQLNYFLQNKTFNFPKSNLIWFEVIVYFFAVKSIDLIFFVICQLDMIFLSLADCCWNIIPVRVFIFGAR